MASNLAEKWTLLDRFIQWYRFRIIATHIPAGCVLADLGCGTGVFLRYMKGRIAQGYGIDTATPDIRVDDKIEFKSGNLEQEVPLADQSVDVVTSLAVLEHLEHPERFVDEIFRILKPGGRCLLTTPSPRAKPILEFLAYRLKIISEKDIADHKTYFDRAMLINLFGKFGNVGIHYFQCGLNTFVTADKLV
jgi:2-polyprenyl-3-methyl-5-hydroxy-6-metoxy-1,4-benzoquinol methylase